MTNILRRLTTAVVAGAALSATFAMPALAEFPEKRLNIIVPYGAGGSTDLVARQIADGLSRHWDGATVTVENRPGAGATIGAMTAARAPADGYTLLMTQVSSHGIAPAVYANIQYDPLGDFDPVVWIESVSNVMVVPTDSPVTTVQEFFDAAKAGGMTYGSAGVGSSIHLSGAMFNDRLGTDMTHVPYKGSGEAIPALVSGNVDVMFDNLPSAISQIKSGTLRALAVTSINRDPALPDVPTLDEVGIEGLAGFEAGSWFGLMAPDGTDPEVIGAINQAVNAVIASDEFKSVAELSGAQVVGGTPDEFRAHIEAELAKWKDVAEMAGVKVE